MSVTHLKDAVFTSFNNGVCMRCSSKAFDSKRVDKILGLFTSVEFGVVKLNTRTSKKYNKLEEKYANARK